MSTLFVSRVGKTLPVTRALAVLFTGRQSGQMMKDGEPSTADSCGLLSLQGRQLSAAGVHGVHGVYVQSIVRERAAGATCSWAAQMTSDANTIIVSISHKHLPTPALTPQ